MYLGLSGSPSLKSKADALKYAIEFTATGEYPNRAPDIKKAKELYNFICENVQLPEDNIDNNRLYTQRSLDEILLHTNACLNDFLEYSKKERRKCNPGKPKPSGKVAGEQAKEKQTIGSSHFRSINDKLRSLFSSYGFKCISSEADNISSRELFNLSNDKEALRVTVIHTTLPIK